MRAVSPQCLNAGCGANCGNRETTQVSFGELCVLMSKQNRKKTQNKILDKPPTSPANLGDVNVINTLSNQGEGSQDLDCCGRN